MADTTDWNTLKERCEAHEASLVMRADTFDGEVRVSLAAIANARPNDRVFEARMNAGENAPQFIVTTLVTKALAEWWQ